MELKEAVEALASHPKEEVSKSLKEHASSVWQYVHDLGFSNANDRAKEKLKVAEESLEEAKKTITERDEKIAELEKGQPELEELRDKHKVAIEKLSAQHVEETNKLTETLAKVRRDGVYNRILSLLSDLDDDYAEVQAQKAMSRIAWDKDGAVEVMQESGVPFVPSDKKDGIALLAEEIVTTTTETKPRMVKSDVDRGGGANNDRGGPHKGKSTVYEEARKRGEEMVNANPQRQKKIATLTGQSVD